MAEYVSREAIKDALVNKFKARIGSCHVPTWNDAFDAVITLPAADVKLVVQGKWIIKNWGFEYSECSVCGYEHRYAGTFNYCPNCGAKMKKGD